MRNWMALFGIPIVSVMGLLISSGCDSHPDKSGQVPTGSEVPILEDVDWRMYGRTSDANHYSPLDQINVKNVHQLGLAWYHDLEVSGSVYTSPIVVGDTLYYLVGLTILHAMEARTGRLLWTYDPGVADVAGEKMRLGWVQRGIAYSDGKIFAGTLDGRLIAVDAATGKLEWSVQTTEGPGDGRYITGPPWIANGKVVIGHGGADTSLIRGYVTAYDIQTGEKAWRFHTVPGNPAVGFENEAMELAASTWTGEWWRFGGGGTVWNAMAYDEKFNRIYLGTGNGTPWNQKYRSPGGGDNLFLCSIVALDADTGEYVWHYQVNPGETWDYNAAMDIELTELNIGGAIRPVLLHAPKNGFFYVIDRETGKLLSAENFVPTNWAERIDLQTGRPVEKPEARYTSSEGSVIWPGVQGGHNAQPMSFSPVTRLAYIPAVENATYYLDQETTPEDWEPGTVHFTGVKIAAPPEPLPPTKQYLLAWDPVKQQAAWSNPQPVLDSGGVTTTGGNLVMRGLSDGTFNIYAAVDGELLWSFETQVGISAQPITYSIDGTQYITLLTGYRGLGYESPWEYRSQRRRVLTFALGGEESLPPFEPHVKRFKEATDITVDPSLTKRGAELFTKYQCAVCHGFNLGSGGAAPDLRESAIPHYQDAFARVVRDGALRQNAMPAFPEFSEQQLEALRHYIIQTTNDAIAGKAPPGAHGFVQ